MDNIIYERNMKALKERYEGLAYIIENKKYKDDREDQIEESFEYAKDGTKIISIEKNKRKLYLNGRYAPDRKSVV